MPIPLFQVFGKVVAFRLNRPKQKGRTRHNSITTNHDSEGISSIPANTSARYSGGVSFAREASDMAQVALPLVQTIAGAIPLVGAPMQAAISGLLTGLQVIDVSACLMIMISLDSKDYHRDAVRTSRTLIA
jgi:hypothetical protein